MLAPRIFPSALASSCSSVRIRGTHPLREGQGQVANCALLRVIFYKVGRQVDDIGAAAASAAGG